MKYIAAITALGASLVMGACATAQPAAGEDAPFVPEGYELTGESRTCLSVRNIDDIDTSNEEAWIVTTNSRDTYLTRVSGGCQAASSSFTYISYNAHGGQLCRGEIVRVIDQGADTTVGSCGIGEFEELSPLPEDAS